MTPETLTAELKRRAVGEGFDLVGVARAEHLQSRPALRVYQPGRDSP